MKILIVEDDVALLEIARIMLKNYEVLIATNGLEAVERYKAERPDIVLMDVKMPKMNGIEATKEILKIDKDAKIIGITAYAENKGREMLGAGVKEVIEKPFTRNQLIETINKYAQ